MNLDDLFNKIYDEAQKKVKYYVIGMWIITDDYNNKGYIVDIMVCKGKAREEALKEAKDYENTIKKITDEWYLILDVGETVLEATKDVKDIFLKISKEEIFPDSEFVATLVKNAEKKEREIDARN